MAGYKHQYVKEFLEVNYPEVEFRVNKKWDGPSVYSFREAIKGIDDDILFMFGDEQP